MKITIRHKHTELIIEDDNFELKDNRSLIYNNQDYVIKLLQKMTDEIIKLQEKTESK